MDERERLAYAIEETERVSQEQNLQAITKELSNYHVLARIANALEQIARELCTDPVYHNH
jgi:hypothetical protein